VKGNLTQKVAELVPKGIPVIGVDGLQGLVRLLEEMSRERAVGLLVIPWTPLGSTQACHHANEVEQPPPLQASGDGSIRNGGEQVLPLAHGVGVAA
jgi:hypothetical protein